LENETFQRKKGNFTVEHRKNLHIIPIFASEIGNFDLRPPQIDTVPKIMKALKQ